MTCHPLSWSSYRCQALFQALELQQCTKQCPCLHGTDLLEGGGRKSTWINACGFRWWLSTENGIDWEMRPTLVFVGKDLFEEVIFDQRTKGREVVGLTDLREEFSKCKKQRVKLSEWKHIWFSDQQGYLVVRAERVEGSGMSPEGSMEQIMKGLVGYNRNLLRILLWNYWKVKGEFWTKQANHQIEKFLWDQTLDAT